MHFVRHDKNNLNISLVKAPSRHYLPNLSLLKSHYLLRKPFPSEGKSLKPAIAQPMSIQKWRYRPSLGQLRVTQIPGLMEAGKQQMLNQFPAARSEFPLWRLKVLHPSNYACQYWYKWLPIAQGPAQCPHFALGRIRCGWSGRLRMTYWQQWMQWHQRPSPHRPSLELWWYMLDSRSQFRHREEPYNRL